jgi:hypothetical protein
MTPSEWLRIGAQINRFWPHQPTLPAAIQEGYGLLSDLEADQVSTSVNALLLDGCEFAPSVGQIRKKVAELQEPRQVWGEVWNEIQHAIDRVGSYRDVNSIQWSNANVAELVRLKDWTYLCTTTDPPSVVEAQSRELWESLRARRIQDRAYEPLEAAGLRRLIERKLTIEEPASA